MLIRSLGKLYIVLSIFFLFAIAYTQKVFFEYGKIWKPDLLGNTSDCINVLKRAEGGTPFSFGFISDTENNDDSLWLTNKLLEQNIDFLVFVGDIVNDALITEHKLFWDAMGKLKPRIPVFIVPSNHDIEEGKFGKEDFENIYGPVNFSFTYNNCFFGFISNIDPEDKNAADFLESALAEQAKGAKHRFVFCARSPRRVRNILFHNESWVSELDKIIETYKVDYEISGDYHRRVALDDQNGTRHIISGSGGSHYKEKDPPGRFKSGTIITVYENAVKEEIVVNDKCFVLTDNAVKHFIFNKIIPVAERRTVIFNLLFAAAIINGFFAVYKGIKGRVAESG